MLYNFSKIFFLSLFKTRDYEFNNYCFFWWCFVFSLLFSFSFFNPMSSIIPLIVFRNGCRFYWCFCFCCDIYVIEKFAKISKILGYLILIIICWCWWCFLFIQCNGLYWFFSYFYLLSGLLCVHYTFSNCFFLLPSPQRFPQMLK